MPETQLRERRLLPVAMQRLQEDPVVLLEGPRSVGKSTLLRQLAQQCGAVVLDLDDPVTKDAVQVDPGTFVRGSRPVFVDEYQKAPIVLDAIKAELNRDGRPGRFLLTGSAHYDSLPAAAQALTGRLTTLAVLPLSQGEQDGVPETFMTRVFEDVTEVVQTSPAQGSSREEVVGRIVAGGFPLALARATASSRNRWFDDYTSLTLERDVRELTRVRQQSALPVLLRVLAGQTGQVLNLERAARASSLDPRTAENYARLLEAVFLIRRLPAWGRTLSSRAAARPKLHVLDTGVAARLLRLSADKLERREATALTELGHLLETFVVGELLKQVSWMDEQIAAGHWRTHDGLEVDLVLERDDGAVLGFEVKANGRAPGADFRPLRALRDAVGGAFLGGCVLYLGDRAYTFEDRLHVLPVDRIWRASHFASSPDDGSRSFPQPKG